MLQQRTDQRSALLGICDGEAAGERLSFMRKVCPCHDVTIYLDLLIFWLVLKAFDNCDYPTLAREFQSFRVWGTLELTDTPTNLANQVKVDHALDQSRSVQSRGPERAHQNNEPSWRSSRTDCRLSRQFWDDYLVVFTFSVWDKNKNPFWMASLTLIFTRSLELRTHSA